jgi:hypothetical protein
MSWVQRTVSNEQYRYCRDWVFTLNNPVPAQMKLIHESEKIRYMIYQLELASTGTKHLQGYVEFHEPISFDDMISIFGEFHFDKRRGSREQARAYSSKEETRIRGPWIHGQWIEDDEYQEVCEALTLKGKRCANYAILGEKTCKTHEKEKPA